MADCVGDINLHVKVVPLLPRRAELHMHEVVDPRVYYTRYLASCTV